MAQAGTILQHSRTDIQLTGTQQGVGPGLPANVLFIYIGEVGCQFVSDSGTTLHDQLSIELPDADLGTGQLPHIPVPIILPTDWNALSGPPVLAVDNPTLSQKPNSLSGLILTADISVQNAMLLRVQYQVAVLVRL
jgi:hypothetical protein